MCIVSDVTTVDRSIAGVSTANACLTLGVFRNDKGLQSNLQPARRFHQDLLHEYLSGGHHRLGDVLLGGYERYANSGAYQELLRIDNLLSDPAMRLQ